MNFSTMLHAIKRLFSQDKDAVMDHVAVKRPKQKRDWRDKELIRAAEKHGKPFKAASASLHREVMTEPATFTTVKGGEKPGDAGKPVGTVTAIAKGRS